MKYYKYSQYLYLADYSKKMKGQIDFTPEELAKIEERLNFKINLYGSNR